MRRRGGGAQQDVVRTVGAKDHLQQLREVFLVGNVVVVLEDVEQVVGLQTVTELLDRLGTDAVDAQQILLGLTNQVADRLDADLAELVGPALRHTQVVEQVQASLLGGDGVAVAGERTVSTTELVVAAQSSCCGSCSSRSLSSTGAHSGSDLALGEAGPSMST